MINLSFPVSDSYLVHAVTHDMSREELLDLLEDIDEAVAEVEFTQELIDRLQASLDKEM